MLAMPAIEAPVSRRPVRRGWKPRYPGEFPTLGWGVLDWTFAHLPSPADERDAFVFTEEQARRVLRIYELDPLTGKRLYRRVHEEEAKGWGKGPFAGTIALAEFRGPVRFDGWDANGQPVGVPWGTGSRAAPWIQVAAVSEDQTYNTWRVVWSLLTVRDGYGARELKIDPGITRLYATDMPGAFMERVTASAGSREGQPLTHAVLDEPQLWNTSNRGHDLAQTILRNLTKMDGWAHFTGNAPILGKESVAEVYGEPAAGALHFATRPAEQPQEDWTDEQKLAGLEETYRDVPWIVRDRLLDDINDPTMPWAKALRFFFNWPTSESDNPWLSADLWQSLAGVVELRKDRPTYAVVTTAHDHRSAAIAVAQREGDRHQVSVRMLPAEPLPDGELIELRAIEAEVRKLRAEYPAPVAVPAPGSRRVVTRAGPEVTYHGAFFEGSAQKLHAEGAVMVDIPDSPENLAPAAETLKTIVLERRIVHDGGLPLANQIGAVRAVEAPTGWKIGNASAAARAVIVAVHRAVSADDPSRVNKPATFRSW